MRFKLDENVDVRAARVLREAGHDVDTVLDEGLCGAPDSEVARTANEGGRILVTLDRGLADLRVYPPGSHPGIVLLRLRLQTLLQINEALQLLLSYERLETLGGCTVVVGSIAVWVRRPPT